MRESEGFQNLEADIANLRAAVAELQETVLYLADELDRRELPGD